MYKDIPIQPSLQCEAMDLHPLPDARELRASLEDRRHGEIIEPGAGFPHASVEPQCHGLPAVLYVRGDEEIELSWRTGMEWKWEAREGIEIFKSGSDEMGMQLLGLFQGDGGCGGLSRRGVFKVE